MFRLPIRSMRIYNGIEMRKGNSPFLERVEQLQFPKDGSPPREVLVGVYLPFSNSSDAEIQWDRDEAGELTIWWEG